MTPTQQGDEMSALWHPFADMGAASRAPFIIDRGEGAWVFDAAGNRYLDATASLWYANLGHGRHEIQEAIARQLERLDAYSIFGDYANQPALDLAARLAALAPTPNSKVFLGTGGGEMIDTAAKIARAHFAQSGQPERTHLISRRFAYHGSNGFGTTVGGIDVNVRGWGRLVPDASIVAHDDAQALGNEIRRVGPDKVAAFFCEPVIGAGGVRLPPDGYIEDVVAICRENGVLFIADSVISGFGRLGTWFGIDRWPVEPDLIVLAKGITSGVLPLGAVIVAEHVAAPFFTDGPGAPVLRHGPTYAGHPTCCAAALATLDLYERENLIERGRTLEGALAAALDHAGHPLVGEVRAGLGLLGAVALRGDVLAGHPTAPSRLQSACREAGVLVRPVADGVAVSPPLIIDQPELDQLHEGLGQALTKLEAELGSLAVGKQ
jgi:putrescine---pyruvate transaminase